MTRIFAGISRAPDYMFSRLSLSRIAQTNVGLLKVQNELSTGRVINNPSDDPVRMAAVLELDDRLERSQQRVRNISHAQAALGVLDNAIVEANDIGLSAKEIALTQVGFGSSPEERKGQAIVVQSMLDSLYNISNRRGSAGFLFSGSKASAQAFERLGGGYRYMGEGAGLLNELFAGSEIPITTTPDGIGGTSARIRGDVDLDPALTGQTRIMDLAGARGLGVTLGEVSFSFNGGTRATVDLAGADTVEDILTAIVGAIRTYETDNGVTVLGPGGVTTAGGAISIDILGGGTLEFFEAGTGVTARDLGLTADPATTFSSATPTGGDLSPTLTWTTPISALTGVVGALGSIRLKNNSGEAVVDLSAAQTLEDVKNRIEGAGLGARVAINAAGTGIDVLSETAAGAAGAMSIEEVAGSNLTATRLGIRSLSGTTRISEFNFGKGVSIVNGTINPVTGQPDPSKDVDFSIVLGDASGTSIDVDLRPQDMTTVGTLIGRINSQIAAGLAAAGLNSTDLVAGLGDGANGIRLVQNGAFPNALRVTARNNSKAAEQLGLLEGRYDSATGSFAGVDRAKARVDGLFSDLMDLREALLGNDTGGIALAGERLEATLTRLAEKRGAVGGLARRVDDSLETEKDRSTLDEKMRSELRDVDFAEAASRFTLLQTQLQAGLQVTAASGSRTLLDFLG